MKVLILILISMFLSQNLLAEEAQVEVENPFYFVKENGKTKIVTDTYRDRRSDWGIRTEVGSSFYDPVEEDVSRSGVGFYGSFAFNRNFNKFSLGPELSLLSISFDNTPENSEDGDISALAFMMGGNIYLDGLLRVPYVVPFFGFGLASFDIDNDEISDSETKEDFSTYYKAGVLVQLNWLDKINAARGYYNYGLENTFVVLQIRNISKTDSNQLLNVGSSMTFEAGLQLEF